MNMTEMISPEAPDWGRNYGLFELWTKVQDGLWVGGTDDFDTTANAMPASRNGTPSGAANITRKEFDSVVTLYAWARPVDWLVEEYRWGIYDGGPDAPDVDQIREVVVWAHKRWKSGNKVLLRCQAGLSRSVFFTALVLIRDGWEPQEAIDHIRSARSPYCFSVNASSRGGHFTNILYNTPVEFWRDSDEEEAGKSSAMASESTEEHGPQGR